MAMAYQHNFKNYLFLQRLAPKTNESYLRAVTQLSDYHDQPAAELTNAQIQDFLLHCIVKKEMAWASCNVLFCGLKKFYQGFLGRSDAEFSIPSRPRSRQLPMLLGQEDVLKILQAHDNIKHRALLATIYGSGLRVSEAVKLKAVHIESERMSIRVEQSKGHKDRYTVLSQKCLELLREYWLLERPGEWLFFGRNKQNHMSISSAQNIYYQARDKANIKAGRGIHTLRHCFATHCIESGVPLHILKSWMGHSSIKITCNYLHISPDYLSKLKSPLDFIDLGDES